MNCIEYLRFSNILANTAVAIFRAKSLEGFGSPCIDQKVGGEWDVKVRLGQTEKLYIKLQP
jgi:hypothetical protein